MLYKNVTIESIGYEIPKNVVTSLSLEERLSSLYDKLNLSFGRLEIMSGIRERRFWDDETSPSLIGIRLAERAITQSGIDKGEIECLLHASVCRDHLDRSTATLIHDSIGLPLTTATFDISNACMGFTNGIIVLANMIELGQVEAGIIIGSEGSKQLIESTIDELLNDENVDRAKLKRAFATLTLGSGAAVVMLVHSSISSNGHKLLGGAVRTASKYNGLCRIENDTCFFDPGRSPTMKTDYESILRVGQMLAPETWNATKRELCWDDHDVDKVFFHQVSAVHHKLLFEALGLDESKGFSTVEYLGNVASCSLPISFALGIEEGLIHKGDKVLLVAGGSGISSVMLGIEW